MNKSIYILGSSGFAKEVYFLLKEIGGYNFKAFIDIVNKERLCFQEGAFDVITEEEFLERENPETAILAIGIGDPKLIKKLAEKFKDFSFPNLIHPSAIYDKSNVRFGKGNILVAGVLFTTCITVGDMNIFNLSSTVGHDAVIGNYNVINPTVNISGGVEIGTANLIGVGATILQYKKIGNDSIVGAASLVTKDVEDNSIVIGVPAKKM
ncbi:MAG: acetyltransferase [Taibaiella sp.]|jgi:sugar O-acyltransferase (sialic acid O-acetyltransferase NeuD family)